jgi:hypothetical protein
MFYLRKYISGCITEFVQGAPPSLPPNRREGMNKFKQLSLIQNNSQPVIPPPVNVRLG